MHMARVESQKSLSAVYGCLNCVILLRFPHKFCNFEGPITAPYRVLMLLCSLCFGRRMLHRGIFVFGCEAKELEKNTEEGATAVFIQPSLRVGSRCSCMGIRWGGGHVIQSRYLYVCI